MICKNCGMTLPNGTEYCPNCGSSQNAGQTLNPGGQIGNYGTYNPGGQNIYPGGGTNPGGQIPPIVDTAPPDPKKKGIKPIDSDEKIIYTMKNSTGWLDALLNFKVFGINSNTGMITDKRVYYSGKTYYKRGKNLSRLYEKRTVDLQDVTSTGFSRITHISWIISAVIFALAAIGMFITAYATGGEHYRYSFEDNGYTTSYYEPNQTFFWIAFYCFIFAIICLALFLITIRNIYEITYASGSIVINVSKFKKNAENVRKFDEILRKTKDKRLKHGA